MPEPLNTCFTRTKSGSPSWCFPDSPSSGAAMTTSPVESNSVQTNMADAQQSPGLTPVLERKIRSLDLRRAREEARASLEQRIAQAITD
jgi:hypothetical protein